MDTILLTSAYLPPVQYFAHLYAARRVVEERCDTYQKQTYRNRCVIASANGPLALTVPVEHSPQGSQPMRDVRLSEHGRWRQVHWTALVSAYEHSPYFPYYADEFRPLFEERRFRFLVDFNTALRELVCDLLSLTPDVTLTSAYAATPPPGVLDCRTLISPKRPYTDDPLFTPVPYYQVFAARLGFLPNLSIADLLFNMGPEARLVLRQCCRQ